MCMRRIEPAAMEASVARREQSGDVVSLLGVHVS